MGDQTHVFEDEGRSEHENGQEDVEAEKPSNATVQVVIRLRPPDPVDEPTRKAENGEYDLSESFEFRKTSSKEGQSLISIKDPLSRGRSEHTFQFSGIFHPEHKQDAIFTNIAKPMVDRLFCGYNTCIFAYGQTGSGKTHSIFGEGNGENRGLLPRSIEYLFENIKQVSSGKQVGLVVSFLEVYLDQIQDLGRGYANRARRMEVRREERGPTPPSEASGIIRTGPVRTGPGRIRPYSAQTSRGAPPPVLEKRPWSATEKRPTSAQSHRSCDQGADANPTGGDLDIREAPNGQVYVQNLSLIPVRNISEVMEVVNQGLALRATYETKMNPTSSRSHTVFTINLVQKDLKKGREAETMTSHFNLIDLAGSERLAKSKSEGKRFHEAVVINASLSALGRVVLALASNSKIGRRYVPYRDSKLTRILQSGLGGNSITTLLCCINPSSEHYEENLNSLSFADRCKNVDNRPMINFLEANENSGKLKIRALKREIEDLKSQLAVMRDGFIDPRLQSMNLNEHLRDIGALEDAKEKQREAIQEAMSLKEKQKKAAEEIETYQRGKSELDAREAERVLEVRGLKEETARRLEKLRQVKAESEIRIKDQGDRLWNIIRQAQKDAKLKLEQRDKIFIDLPNVLRDTKNIIQERCNEYEEKLKTTRQKHMAATETISLSHEEQLSNIEKKYQYWLEEKERDMERYEKEMSIFSQKMRKELKEHRTEIVGLYDLTRQLTRIIQDMESGVYPVSYKCNIKTVMLPVGAGRPKVLKDVSEYDFPHLFTSLRDTKAKAEKYERLMNKYSLNNLTHDGGGGGGGPDDGGGGADNLTNDGERSGFTAAGIKRDFTGSPSPEETTMDLFDRTKSTMAGSMLHDFDATRFSMEFCRSREENNDALLSTLNEDKLRALVCSLKERCRGEFDIQAEKQKIRDEVMHELSGHSTIEYLRHLENEVERYKASAQKEVDHSNNLKVALTHAMNGKA